MAKAKKQPTPRPEKYEDRLTVKPGSFLDIVKATARHAEKNAAKKKQG